MVQVLDGLFDYSSKKPHKHELLGPERCPFATSFWLPHSCLPLTFTVIQRILRHSTVATTQNHYIKTASPDAIAAMRQFSEALLCSNCAPDGDLKLKSSVL